MRRGEIRYKRHTCINDKIFKSKILLNFEGINLRKKSFEGINVYISIFYNKGKAKSYRKDLLILYKVKQNWNCHNIFKITFTPNGAFLNTSHFCFRNIATESNYFPIPLVKQKQPRQTLSEQTYENLNLTQQYRETSSRIPFYKPLTN